MVVNVKKRNKGFTKLLDGKKVRKYHLRPETYGTIDELNSFLGSLPIECFHLTHPNSLSQVYLK